jgi:hypothetical protein
VGIFRNCITFLERGEQWIGELWGFLEIVLLFWKGGNNGFVSCGDF